MTADSQLSDPALARRLHDALPPALRQWVCRQAEAMGLPGPDDYVLLLLTLEKQRQDLEGVPELYRLVFRAALTQTSDPVPNGPPP